MVLFFFPVYGFHITGNAKAVFVCDPDLIFEAANSLDFADKEETHLSPRIRFGTSVNGEQPGLGTSSGQTWREQRKFTVLTLREMGFGRQSMEQLIAEEVEGLVEALDCEGGNGKTPLNPKTLFGKLNTAFT